MKKLLIYITFLFLSPVLLNAQSNSVSAGSLKSIPGENLFVHLNTSTLFVGEYALFKIYNSEGNSNKLSDISKIAYIAIINSDGRIVHQENIALRKGVGSGDYFIPTSMPSGNYKLIAYTNWMKNNAINKFFEQDLFIINPYTSEQDIISTENMPENNIKNNVEELNRIKLNKKNYAAREKVMVELVLPENSNYSVSIRKTDYFPGPDLKSISENNKIQSDGTIAANSVNYIPELRGKILSGKVINSENTTSNLKNINLALSVPGDDYFFRLGSTNDQGEFYFNIADDLVDEDAILQIIGERKEDYKIQLSPDNTPNITNLEFQNFKVNSSMKEAILKRSVSNQIENAYFSLKPDTVKTSSRSNIFDGIDKVVYKLDDYKRFKSINETFTEIIPDARVRRNRDKYEFAVLGKEPYNDFQGSPLVIIDGLYIQDADEFIRGFESAKIETIKVIRDKYFLSSMYFKGVVIIETFNSNFHDTYSKEYFEKIKLNSGNPHKSYFKQVYNEKSQNDNIPDMRSQLLWEPNAKSENNNLEFYTSDLTGIFEISVQGFDADGKPISLYRTFAVN